MTPSLRLKNAVIGGLKASPGLLSGRGWECISPTLKFALTRKLRSFTTSSGYQIANRQQLMSWWGHHIEASIYKGWTVNPGEVVLDIGANYGVFGWEVKHRYPQAHIIGYEPDKCLAEYCRNLRLNGRPVYHSVIPVALSDRTGKSTLYVRSSEGSWTASLLSDCGGEWEPECEKPTAQQQCKTVRLDDLKTAPVVIKIDVDGGEMLVASGGLVTLRSARYVICELSTADRVREFSALLNRKPVHLCDADYLFVKEI